MQEGHEERLYSLQTLALQEIQIYITGSKYEFFIKENVIKYNQVNLGNFILTGLQLVAFYGGQVLTNEGLVINFFEYLKREIL